MSGAAAILVEGVAKESDHCSSSAAKLMHGTLDLGDLAKPHTYLNGNGRFATTLLDTYFDDLCGKIS